MSRKSKRKKHDPWAKFDPAKLQRGYGKDMRTTVNTCNVFNLVYTEASTAYRCMHLLDQLSSLEIEFSQKTNPRLDLAFTLKEAVFSLMFANLSKLYDTDSNGGCVQVLVDRLIAKEKEGNGERLEELTAVKNDIDAAESEREILKAHRDKIQMHADFSTTEAPLAFLKEYPLSRELIGNLIDLAVRTINIGRWTLYRPLGRYAFNEIDGAESLVCFLRDFYAKKEQIKPDDLDQERPFKGTTKETKQP